MRVLRITGLRELTPGIYGPQRWGEWAEPVKIEYFMNIYVYQ